MENRSHASEAKPLPKKKGESMLPRKETEREVQKQKTGVVKDVERVTKESCSYSRIILERFNETVNGKEAERSVIMEDYKTRIEDIGKTRHKRGRVLRAGEILKLKERTVTNMEFIHRVFVDVFKTKKKPEKKVIVEEKISEHSIADSHQHSSRRVKGGGPVKRGKVGPSQFSQMRKFDSIEQRLDDVLAS